MRSKGLPKKILKKNRIISILFEILLPFFGELEEERFVLIKKNKYISHIYYY